MAAGLSLTQDQLEPAMARLGELLAAQGAGDRPPRSLRLDGLLTAGGATPELAAALAAAGPYGAGAPAPRLALAASRITGARRIGDGHLALRLADGLGGHLDAVAFRAFETPLGSFLEAQAGAAAHLAGRLERDDGPAAPAPSSPSRTLPPRTDPALHKRLDPRKARRYIAPRARPSSIG